MGNYGIYLKSTVRVPFASAHRSRVIRWRSTVVRIDVHRSTRNDERQRTKPNANQILVERQRKERKRRADANGTRSCKERYFLLYCN